jgi:uncharacterized membrane protein|tara:strand:- start:5599 stop:6075 length:477 start_codon:yes stop_codon:yes gene_type:complete
MVKGLPGGGHANRKRSVAKTFLWRGVATTDTIIISRVITGSWTEGLAIGVIEVFTKMILYYFHERAWSTSDWGLGDSDAAGHANRKRSIAKTFLWRGIATTDTIIISRVITGSWTEGLAIGTIEVFTKMILYYFHERAWSASDWGLEDPDAPDVSPMH